MFVIGSPVCILTTIDSSKPETKRVNIKIVSAEEKYQCQKGEFSKSIMGRLTEEQLERNRKCKREYAPRRLRPPLTEEQREADNRRHRERYQRLKKNRVSVRQNENTKLELLNATESAPQEKRNLLFFSEFKKVHFINKLQTRRR